MSEINMGVLRISSLAVLMASLLLAQPAIDAQTRQQAAGTDQQLQQTALEQALGNLEWRPIGPANMGGRVTDVRGVPGNPNIAYVATASGGVWKTLNGGITWQPLFDQQPVASIGNLALEPGNHDVVWVGTGEANVRNSVSFGNGVYRSTDGGKTWRHLGLDKTERISRILVNPRNPDIVYVGALGHAYGPSEHRGVYMTTDGGETWKKVLYTDDRHGVSDLEMDPQNPNVLFAAMWHFERKPWTHTSGSEEGGIYRSVDGGRTWTKVTKGLPRLVGRLGVKVAPSNSSVVYVIAESNDGILFRSDDGGESFVEVSRERSIVARGFYYTDLRVDPTDENRVYAIASLLFVSLDGGRNFRRISPTTHVDFHALWIDPVNPSRMWQGQDGGVAVSYDRGENWEYVNNFPLGQFYQIYADNREPFYYVGGGLQDNGTWYGPSRTREPTGIHNDDWRLISFGDGFHIVPHPEDPELFLSESQGGNLLRTDMRTREQQVVTPQARRADGGPVGRLKYRFNWNAPIIPSPHDGRTIYFAGNVVFRSRDFGSTWEVISPDLTTNDAERQKSAGGPVWQENTSAEFYTTIISLSESPARQGVLWAGTDDGNIQVSEDDGRTWRNVIENVPGMPRHSPVSHIEPSRTSPGTAYASFHRHLLGDFRPYVFKTTDYGRSWTNITGNLSEQAYVWVLREDPRNTNLVYAGTELGLYASYGANGSWIRLHGKNLPTVSVHDIIIHPRDNDIIIGTHGRSIWVLDDATPVQQMRPELAARSAHLFPPRSGIRFTTRMTRYGVGDKIYQGPNPPYGAVITYHLNQSPPKDTPVKLEIFDNAGAKVREVVSVPREPGLNLAVWDLAHEPAEPRRSAETQVTAFPTPRQGPAALPGQYIARLTVGDQVLEEKMEVRLDPTVDASAAALRRQFDLAMELREMETRLNLRMRALDSVKAQLSERKATVGHLEEPPAEVLRAIETHTRQIDGILGRLARPPAGSSGIAEPSRLAEQIPSLARTIGGVNSAPTTAQEEYAQELRQELDKLLPEADRYLGESTKELNALLVQHQVPPVLVPPRRPGS
jgi:photosystem II stability/assembly factor-like uncharacterized protein